MKTLKTSLAITLSSLFLFGALSAQSAPSFYKCDSGYTFKINNAKTGARCEKRIGAHIAGINCPKINVLGKEFGTFQQVKNGKDRCAGRGVAGVEISHPPGKCLWGYSYKQNHQGKKDMCVKSGQLKIKAPTKKFR